MTRYCGRNFRISIETSQGSNEFVTVAGDRSLGLATNNAPVNASNKDDMPARALVACGENSQTVNLSGFMTDDSSINLVHDHARTGDLRQYQIHNEAGLVHQGFFLCASFERSGEHNGAETFNCVLEGSSVGGDVPPPEVFEYWGFRVESDDDPGNNTYTRFNYGPFESSGSLSSNGEFFFPFNFEEVSP